MADFPAAYKKVFVVTTFYPDGAIEDYSRKDFGFFDARTWVNVPLAQANITAHPAVVLVTPSFHFNDTVGKQGGYQETQKSQIIKPNQVQRFWKVAGRAPQAQVVAVGWNTTDASTAPKFVCGKDYTLRIDLRGASIFRILGLNAFQQYSVQTACCDDPGDPKPVDPIAVMVEFAKQINSESIFKNFIQATVLTGDGADAGTEPDTVNLNTYVPLTDESAIDSALAALVLTINEIDYEQLDECSYDPREGFGNEYAWLLDPTRIIAAQIVQSSIDGCSNSKQLTFTELQPAIRAEGNGRQVLQDFVLSMSYQQDIYPFDARRTLTEDLDRVFDYVNPDAGYDSYYILHTIDRKTNPSGIYDKDRYLIQINVPFDSDMSDFVAWMNSYLASAKPGMAMEDLSDPT